MIYKKITRGFTLIELLVVISIIGILVALSIFGLEGARRSSRDGKRKTDLELVRSGLEIYKSDCNTYPVSNSTGIYNALGTSLAGDGSTSSCSTSNLYISQVPNDPTYPTDAYLYYSDGVSYELCAALEQVPPGTPTIDCGGRSTCGSATCNYKVTNP